MRTSRSSHPAPAIAAVALVALCGISPWRARADPPPPVIRLRAGPVEPSPPGAAPAKLGLTLLTFDAPLTRATRDALRDAGARILGYIPRDTLLVDLSNLHARDAVGDLPNLAGVTPYQPAWKADPSLWELERPEVLIHLMAGEDGQDLLADLAAREGAAPAGVSLVGDTRVLRATVPGGMLLELCHRRDVRFIEPVPVYTPRNTSTRWIVQSNTPNHTPVYDAAISGAGQVIGVMDTKVDPDHCSFLDPDDPIGPDHRKILAYNATLGSQFHGTHVAATALGDAGAFDDTRGVAWGAKLVYSFIPSATTLFDALALHHAQGAFIHSNSWGNDTTKAYDLTARSIDLFSWENDTDLVVFSASNFDEITNPENAKNCLAVGATIDANDFFTGQDWHCSGGVGPTSDGRRKPEIFAPGCNTMSADSGTPCGVMPLTGTSMATPAVSGAAALVRQYFIDGYHPTGSPSPEDALVPTGPLLKAVLINATEDMAFYPETPSYPSFEEGWGHLVLDRALFFPGDSRRLVVRQARNNEPEALQTGDSVSIEIEVVTADEPLAVTLAWHDYPAEIDASFAPVNDLDLSVVSPSFDEYKGNVFDTASGFSIPGGGHDQINNLEHVLIQSPHPGTWTITVGAPAVNVGAQGYALAASGDIGQITPCPADFNDDGSVDVRDFADFKATFNAGLSSADIDEDGKLSIFDFIAFQQIFLAGCE